MYRGIKVIYDFLSKEECNLILNKCKEETHMSNAISVGGNINDRKSSVGWITNLGDLNQRLKNVLKDSFNISGMDVTGLGSFQFTEYKVGEYFNWHIDSNSTIYKDRFASIVIQLNDTYTDGILEIKNVDGETMPIENKIGTLYIFNSNLLHRVTPIESEIRYSLVNWVSLVKKEKQSLI